MGTPLHPSPQRKQGNTRLPQRGARNSLPYLFTQSKITPVPDYSQIKALSVSDGIGKVRPGYRAHLDDSPKITPVPNYSPPHPPAYAGGFYADCTR